MGAGADVVAGERAATTGSAARPGDTGGDAAAGGRWSAVRRVLRVVAETYRRTANGVGRTGRALTGRAVPRAGTVRSGVRDAGMATAEYAIATLAAVGFAGLLVVILRSEEVRGLLLGIVRRALS